jgi:hypothetical protein
MQYLLMLYTKESDWAALTPAQQEERRVPYMAYIDALRKAGAYLGSNRLTPTANGRTVRTTNGKTQVLDGPYADSKEQCGGYVLIDVPDLDAALSWAARCPTASHGAVEVRPVWQMPGPG